MKRRGAQLDSPAPATPVDPSPQPTKPAAPAQTPAAEIHRYGEDLEQRYVTARNAWTLAMRIASSGRPADMASLAIAQEAYETVAEEREQWLAGSRIAIPVEPEPTRNDLEIAVGQELEWRRVLHPEERRGFFGRIRRRLRGR